MIYLAKSITKVKQESIRSSSEAALWHVISLVVWSLSLSGSPSWLCLIYRIKFFGGFFLLPRVFFPWVEGLACSALGLWELNLSQILSSWPVIKTLVVDSPWFQSITFFFLVKSLVPTYRIWQSYHIICSVHFVNSLLLFFSVFFWSLRLSCLSCFHAFLFLSLSLFCHDLCEVFLLQLHHCGSRHFFREDCHRRFLKLGHCYNLANKPHKRL